MKKTIAHSLFEKIIDDRYEIMMKKQKDNPNLVLPRNFDKFVKSPLFVGFLIAIFDYCTEISKLEQKQQILEAQSKERAGLAPKLLSSETDKVNLKLQDVTEIYSMIILQKGSYNYMYRDQNFFETLIYFVTQVLREMFRKEEYKLVEEEINRIFRTNSFNIIKRRHIQEQLEKQFPTIKEKNIKEINLKDQKQLEQLVAKFDRLARIPRRKTKHQMLQEKSDIKPYFIKQTPCASINSCSPLIAMMFPSAKERLFQQERERKNRESELSSKARQNQLGMWMNEEGESRGRSASQSVHQESKKQNQKQKSYSFY